VDFSKGEHKQEPHLRRQPFGRVGLPALLFSLALSCAAAPAKPLSGPTPLVQGSADALARLASLSGAWEGTFQWSGGRDARGPVRATYETTGNGSAVLERLVMDGVPSMMSAYHLDGADLRVTHYCAAKNQPRLRADRIDLAHGVLDFAFVDATNLASPDAPHVEGISLELRDADHVTLTFRFVIAGKTSLERLELARAALSP
jgi:hypothetical protein